MAETIISITERLLAEVPEQYDTTEGTKTIARFDCKWHIFRKMRCLLRTATQNCNICYRIGNGYRNNGNDIACRK